MWMFSSWEKPLLNEANGKVFKNLDKIIRRQYSWKDEISDTIIQIKMFHVKSGFHKQST